MAVVASHRLFRRDQLPGFEVHRLAWRDDGVLRRPEEPRPRLRRRWLRRQERWRHPETTADRIIDDQLSGEAIEQQLAALETQASHSGRAMGSGFAYPVTLDEAARWAGGLAARGYQLAPASAVMARR